MRAGRLALLVAALGASGGVHAVAADGPADRYLQLLQQKRSLLREGALLDQEAKWAATKEPYIFFHLDTGKLEFRIRGRAYKEYQVSAISLDETGRRQALPEAIWRILDKPLTVAEKQGGRPELVPPDPEAGRETGLLYSDPNQIASQTGAIPVDTDAGVLGVDAPTEYFIRFEENVLFHVRSPRPRTFRQKAADRLSEIARGMKSSLKGLWGGSELGPGPPPRMTLYLTIEPEKAKHLHYSLLPGERLMVVPPSPPPVALTASGGASPASDAR